MNCSTRKPNVTDLRVLAEAHEVSRNGQVFLYPSDGEKAAYERLRKLGLMLRNPTGSIKSPEYQISNQGEQVIGRMVAMLSGGGDGGRKCALCNGDGVVRGIEEHEVEKCNACDGGGTL